MTSPATRYVQERDAIDPARFAEEVATEYRPLILRGQARHWPAVQAGARSDEALADYLRGFDGGKPVEVLIG
ncbi:MAG: cupin-like domain-containing protein, partial [Lysobacteraceae bacterium]